MEVLKRFTYDFNLLPESSEDFLEMMKDKCNLGFSSGSFHLTVQFNEDPSSKS